MVSERKDILSLILTVTLTGALLSAVQVMPPNPLLLGERWIRGGGWIQVALAMLYAGWLCLKMQDRKERPVWRKRAWLLFSIVFFGQLALGILADPIFLMTGKLHLPIPAVILAGPLYRFEGLFMPVLFISTLLLSGPAWCSQLCYFGAFDAWSARGKMEREIFPYHKRMRYSVLFLVVAGAILLRLLGASGTVATVLGLMVGLIGLLIMSLLSRKRRKMIHCSSYCPIGTMVSFLKYLSPFRLRLTKDCCHCMACTNACRYDALHREEIERGKIGPTCTYCGDCLSACRHGAIVYRFPGLRPANAERLWIIVTVVLHTCFLMIARI